jgi:uracil-DNA glycosylase family 4
MTSSIYSKLKVIQDQVNSCTKCELHINNINYVFARGNPEASIVIIGEGPGESEAEQGIPFVGRPGKLLDETLTLLGLNVQQDIYVCNIIKCRSPNNRKPTENEINHCIDYLDEQLKIINPKVIIALGNTAVSTLTNTPFGISKVRGTFLKYKKIPVIPVYHPSFVLRNGSTGPVYDNFKNDLQLAINKSKEIT